MHRSLQGEYLSSLRACYDDRLFPAPGAESIDGPSASDASATASSSSTPAAAATASGSGGVNFQQKIEVAPLDQLTAMGDVAGDDTQLKADDSQGQFAAAGHWSIARACVRACQGASGWGRRPATRSSGSASLVQPAQMRACMRACVLAVCGSRSTLVASPQPRAFVRPSSIAPTRRASPSSSSHRWSIRSVRTPTPMPMPIAPAAHCSAA